MKKAAVKEIFSTIQGEGHHTGTAAVFIRFSGCNFWSGREEHRNTISQCAFCDTDFVGTDGVNGGRFQADELARAARRVAPRARIAVCTGGEPLLQLTQDIIDALHEQGFKVHIETNGSIDTDLDGIDWLCCSPKDPKRLNLTFCNELKVILPAEAANIEGYRAQFRRKGPHMFVQPEDGLGMTQRSSMNACIEWVRENPDWRISVQTHKILGVP